MNQQTQSSAGNNQAQDRTPAQDQSQGQPQPQAQAQTQAQNPNSRQQTAEQDTQANTQASQPDQTNPADNPQDPQNQAPFPNVHLEESQLAPGLYRPIPEEDVLEWTAPSRPFKKHNKKYFSTVAVIALLISLILGFAGQLVAVTVVISLAFVVYVLSVVPPQNSTFKITTYGIRIDAGLYYWEELGYFWFDKKYDQDLLYIQVARFPGRLTLLLGDQDKELLTAVLSEVLINKKPEPTLYEKTSAWLQEKIPLDLDDEAQLEDKTKRTSTKKVKS